MKGVTKAEQGILEDMMGKQPYCDGKPSRHATPQEWMLVQEMITRGLIVSVPCSSRKKHEHMQITTLGLEVLRLQRLAGKPRS